LSTLTKEERRQLFEQKVREQEIMNAANSNYQNEYRQQQHEKQSIWVFDTQNNKWIQRFLDEEDTHTNFSAQSVNMATPNFMVPAYRENEKTLMSSAQSNFSTKSVESNESISHHNETIHLSSVISQNRESSNLSLTKGTSAEILKAHIEMKPLDSLISKNDDCIKSPTINKKPKLPSDWKCKKNKKGKIYYFNVKTKKSQWHFPHSPAKKPSIQVDSKYANSTENLTKNKSDSNSINYNESDEQKLKEKETQSIEHSFKQENITSISGDSGVTSSFTESFKICKTQFREKISKMVVDLLQAYFKKSDSESAIKDINDFKTLARKFTHTIMDREISRVTNIQDLDVDNRIKLKSEEYIKNYMINLKNKVKSNS
jgi:hypothetical protein